MAFSSIVLSAGTARLTRRPIISRVRRKWSPSGSKPKRLMRKPSLPRAAPWQLPVLQPARMKTGITSSRNDKGGVAVACATLTGTLTDWPPKATARVVSPSATGQKVWPSRRSKAGLAGVMAASACHVAGEAVGEGGLHDDQLAVAGGGQVDVGREDLDLRRRGLLGCGHGAEEQGRGEPERWGRESSSHDESSSVSLLRATPRAGWPHGGLGRVQRVTATIRTNSRKKLSTMPSTSMTIPPSDMPTWVR